MTTAVGASAEATRAAIARADARLEWFGLVAGAPAGPGWFGRDELLSDGAAGLRAWLEGIEGAFRAPPATAAAYALGWYASAVVTAAVTLLVAESRAVPAGAAVVRVHRAPGWWPDAAAVDPVGGTLLVLPGDELAGTAGVTVVPDPEALRAAVVADCLDHLEPVAAAVGDLSRLGRRSRLALVADAIGIAAAEAGRLAGSPAAGVAQAGGLLAAAGTRLPYRPAWQATEDACAPRLALRRAGCCLAYRVPGQEACTSCPRLSDAERSARLAGED